MVKQSPSCIQNGRRTHCCIEYTALTAAARNIKFGNPVHYHLYVTKILHDVSQDATLDPKWRT